MLSVYFLSGSVTSSDASTASPTPVKAADIAQCSSGSASGFAPGQQPTRTTAKAGMAYQPMREKIFIESVTAPLGAPETIAACSLSAPTRGSVSLQSHSTSGALLKVPFGR